MFLRTISEIIIMTNLKLHKFLKHAGCPKGEGGVTKFGQSGKGVKNLTFCQTSFVNAPLQYMRFYTLLDSESCTAYDKCAQDERKALSGYVTAGIFRH